MSFADVTSSPRTLAVVGLAKNTGKTQTLRQIVHDASQAGVTIGVTSVGRDGEPRDVINPAIKKPPIDLGKDDLVATTEPLLRACGTKTRLLAETGYRTPLGRVVIARLEEAGRVDVAGPSTIAGIASAIDAMLDLGAQRVIVDGAVDRRAAGSPRVTESMVMATGAVLGADVAEVVARTKEAVDLLTLPTVTDPVIRELAEHSGGSALVFGPGQVVPLPPEVTLGASAARLGAVLRDRPDAGHLILAGALCDALVEQVLRFRSREPPTIVVRDASTVLLDGGLHRYRRSLRIEVISPTRLVALTVNPLAPQSHRLDSRELRERLSEAVPGVPVYDVLAYDVRPVARS
jgi:hypothetical protein